MKKQKNIIRSADEYTKYYGDFRGVDFSSDHTQVDEHRFAYAINMYKDYRNGEGNAIETIPGFRRRFEAPRELNSDSTVKFLPINGIHEFSFIDNLHQRDKDILVHAGQNLYLWDKYPLSANVVLHFSVNIINKTSDDDNDGYDDYKYRLDFPIEEIKSVSIAGSTFTEGYIFTKSGKNEESYLQFKTDFIEANKGKTVLVNYVESKVDKPIFIGMHPGPSQSFVFNNKLYIIDGNEYYEYSNGVLRRVTEIAYIPIVYNNITLGDNAPADMRDHENEQMNLLSDKYIHAYIADGSDKYTLYSDDEIDSIIVYDEPISDEQYIREGNYIKFTSPPPPPANMGKPDGYNGVEIVFVKSDDDIVSDQTKILQCTKFALFDKRVFLTGNPQYPNNIWYCGINNVTGYEDCTYFGELNVVIDGVENAPITGLISVADTLAALKNHAKQDGTIYFHSRMETDNHIVPVTYPASQGLSGYGCLGACINFLDDPIFISSLGVEGIGQLSVRLERAIEHRSSLIDAKLVNLNLENAQVTEWEGYLVVLVDGHIFLGDARQKFAGKLGQPEYEWYYLEDIGIYEDQVKEYYYASAFYAKDYNIEDVIVSKDGLPYRISFADQIYNNDFLTSENKINTPVDIKDNDDIFTDDRFQDVYFVVKDTWDGVSYEGVKRKLVRKAIICEDRGSFTSGQFYPAKKIINIDENLFFGTDTGIVCSFNFDQRLEDGTVLPTSYAFDNRTIYCGIATKMDNCGIPHLNKSTIKKSTVIKTKSLISAVTKVRIRTNKSGYKSIARINSRIFSFADTDFSDFSFISTDQTIFSIKEKEKHWVEKQHWLYSDEYQRPFSVYYLAFRYKVSGRIKEYL